MIADKNGKELKAGDVVTVRCVVSGVYPGGQYDVCLLKPAEAGCVCHTETFGLNSKQVELVAAAPAKTKAETITPTEKADK